MYVWDYSILVYSQFIWLQPALFIDLHGIQVATPSSLGKGHFVDSLISLLPDLLVARNPPMVSRFIAMDTVDNTCSIIVNLVIFLLEELIRNLASIFKAWKNSSPSNTSEDNEKSTAESL